MAMMNKQVILIKHPQGAIKDNDFKLVETPLSNLKDGDVLLKTTYFSLDPYMRSRLNEIRSYAASYELGDPILGGSVCQVESSKHPDLKSGDILLAGTGWQEYAIIKPEVTPYLPMGENQVHLINKEVKHSLYLGSLGMPGFTAYHGLFSIGEPKEGETVVVSAATGAVGAMVGQFAKLHGCNVVGIAGGSEKCNYAVDVLGFDACVDHHKKTLAKDLKEACPKGVDIYFENVGGPVLEAVFPLLNVFARIPVCGAIYWYNDTATLAEKNFHPTQILSRASAFSHLFMHLDHLPVKWMQLIGKRIKIQGFLNFDHVEDYPKFLEHSLPLIKEGKIVAKEDIVKGIDNTIDAFSGLFQGKNFGKLLVEI